MKHQYVHHSARLDDVGMTMIEVTTCDRCPMVWDWWASWGRCITHDQAMRHLRDEPTPCCPRPQ